MRLEMQGTIVNVSAKVDASANLVKRVTLEVSGDLGSLQELMRTPLVIGFDLMQLELGGRGKEPA